MAFTQVPAKSSGDVFTVAMWNTYIEANLNKLGVQMHRQLSVAAFLALTGLEDGDEAYVEVDGTNGVDWHMRYDSGTTKWRFLGGPALRADVATDETTTSSSFADLSTTGPSVTVPLLADYDVTIGAMAWAASNFFFISLKIGAASAADADGCLINQAAPGTTMQAATGFRNMRKTATPASTVLKLQYRNSGSVTTHFMQRCLYVTPVKTA